MALILALIPMAYLVHLLEKWVMKRQKAKKPIICVDAVLVNHRQQFSGYGMTHYEKSFLTFQLGNGKGERIRSQP